VPRRLLGTKVIQDPWRCRHCHHCRQLWSARGERMDVWRHHDVVQERQRSAAFTAAAKQGVINLTSLDFNKAKEDVSAYSTAPLANSGTTSSGGRMISLRSFRTPRRVTEGSATATAVESMSKDSAVVLVLANERVTNSTGAKDEPRSVPFPGVGSPRR